MAVAPFFRNDSDTSPANSMGLNYNGKLSARIPAEKTNYTIQTNSLPQRIDTSTRQEEVTLNTQSIQSSENSMIKLARLGDLVRQPQKFNGMKDELSEHPLGWYRGVLGLNGASPLNLLTIQATPFCNINCEYCYLQHRSDKSVFDLKLLPLLFENLKNSGLLNSRLSISWHAGEPLVLPVQYYRDAIGIIERLQLGTVVTHNFQTNATLISDEYCNLFMRPDVQVSMSIDGPAFLHDARRKTRSGTGTHAKAMEGLRRLQARGIRYNAIAVISYESLSYADEIYEFFRDNKFEGVGLNIDELEGHNKNTSLDKNDASERYAAFLSRIIFRANKDGRLKWIREVDQSLRRLNDGFQGLETMSPECNPMSLLTVDAVGRLYTFSPELAGLDDGAHSIGHISEVDFKKLWENEKFLNIHYSVQKGVQICRDSCRYFSQCGGGAPVNKLYENRTFESADTIFCKFKKKITYDVSEDFALQLALRRRGERIGERR